MFQRSGIIPVVSASTMNWSESKSAPEVRVPIRENPKMDIVQIQIHRVCGKTDLERLRKFDALVPKNHPFAFLFSDEAMETLHASFHLLHKVYDLDGKTSGPALKDTVSSTSFLDLCKIMMSPKSATEARIQVLNSILKETPVYIISDRGTAGRLIEFMKGGHHADQILHRVLMEGTIFGGYLEDTFMFGVGGDESGELIMKDLKNWFMITSWVGIV